MNVLLIRLMGPMQSWGLQSRFPERDTGLEPSKSGVVGLLCAAQGKSRDDISAVQELAGLKMGVRVDRPGALRYDYHTAQNVREANAKHVDLSEGKGVRDSVSRRFYLSDAAFLVGLESDNLSLLARLQDKLQNPHWALYLGRRAFVPSAPIHLKDGLRVNQDLETALKSFPWLERKRQEDSAQLRVVLEDENGDQVRPDQPLSFARVENHCAPRRVKTDYWETPREILKEAI
jgi:CRISPR system Cascade subunit CasD